VYDVNVVSCFLLYFGWLKPDALHKSNENVH
jgi:hypothetical protein